MIRKLLTISALGIGLSSCTVSHSLELTGNPIGTKEGVSKNSFAKDDAVFGAVEAAKNGNITTIGAVEVKHKNYLIINKIITKVYGE